MRQTESGTMLKMPEAASMPAPSSLPAEAESSNSLSAPGTSASATDTLDQVMSEGRAVLLTQRSLPITSLRQRDSTLITPRAMLSCFWTILTLVDQLNGVVKSVVGVGRFNCALRDKLRACGSDGSLFQQWNHQGKQVE